MERNRIRYFMIAVVFFVLGYFTRTLNGTLCRELSFVLICAGSYFIFAIWFKKAAAWVLIIVNFIFQSFWHYLSRFSVELYNYIYNSEIGGLILGAPFELKIFFFIFLGTISGAALELGLRQFNKVGMG